MAKPLCPMTELELELRNLWLQSSCFLITPISQKRLQKTTSRLSLRMYLHQGNPQSQAFAKFERTTRSGSSHGWGAETRTITQTPGSISGARVAGSLRPPYLIWRWCPRPECAPARPWYWGSCAARLGWPSSFQTCSSSVGTQVPFSPLLSISQTTCNPRVTCPKQAHPLLPKGWSPRHAPGLPAPVPTC